MKVYNIPGWKNSNEDHWQSVWECNEPDVFERITQSNWANPKREEWVRNIGKILKGREDVLVTSHSIGCAAFIHAVSDYKLSINGALLVAPSDPEQLNYPDEIEGFTPVPLMKLPFPSIVVASSNDQAVSIDRAEYFADCWGSEFIKLPDAGHIDDQSGFREWKFGRGLLEKW
ncbi:MAG: serine hydrolase family protein [Cyclobacteriaceae bacterium]